MLRKPILEYRLLENLETAELQIPVITFSLLRCKSSYG